MPAKKPTQAEQAAALLATAERQASEAATTLTDVVALCTDEADGEKVGVQDAYALLGRAYNTRRSAEWSVKERRSSSSSSRCNSPRSTSTSLGSTRRGAAAMASPKVDETDTDRLARLAEAPPVIQILAAMLAAEERPKEESDG